MAPSPPPPFVSVPSRGFPSRGPLSRARVAEYWDAWSEAGGGSFDDATACFPSNPRHRNTFLLVPPEGQQHESTAQKLVLGPAPSAPSEGLSRMERDPAEGASGGPAEGASALPAPLESVPDPERAAPAKKAGKASLKRAKAGPRPGSTKTAEGKAKNQPGAPKRGRWTVKNKAGGKRTRQKPPAKASRKVEDSASKPKETQKSAETQALQQQQEQQQEQQKQHQGQQEREQQGQPVHLEQQEATSSLQRKQSYRDSEGRMLRLLPSGRYELVSSGSASNAAAAAAAWYAQQAEAAPAEAGDIPHALKMRLGSFRGVAGVSMSEDGAFVRRLPQRLPYSSYPRHQARPAIPIKVRVLGAPVPSKRVEQTVKPPSGRPDGFVYFQLYQVQQGGDKENRRVVAYAWKPGHQPEVSVKRAYHQAEKQAVSSIWAAASAAASTVKKAFQATAKKTANKDSTQADHQEDKQVELQQQQQGQQQQQQPSDQQQQWNQQLQSEQQQQWEQQQQQPELQQWEQQQQQQPELQQWEQQQQQQPELQQWEQQQQQWEPQQWEQQQQQQWEPQQWEQQQQQQWEPQQWEQQQHQQWEPQHQQWEPQQFQQQQQYEQGGEGGTKECLGERASSNECARMFCFCCGASREGRVEALKAVAHDKLGGALLACTCCGSRAVSQLQSGEEQQLLSQVPQLEVQNKWAQQPQQQLQQQPELQQQQQHFLQQLPEQQQGQQQEQQQETTKDGLLSRVSAWFSGGASKKEEAAADEEEAAADEEEAAADEEEAARTASTATEDGERGQLVPACEVRRPQREKPLPGRNTDYVPVKLRVLKAKGLFPRPNGIAASLAASSSACPSELLSPRSISGDDLQYLGDEPIRFAVVQVQTKGDKERRRIVAFKPPCHSMAHTALYRDIPKKQVFDYTDALPSCEETAARCCLPRGASESSLESMITMGFEYRRTVVKSWPYQQEEEQQQQQQGKGLALLGKPLKGEQQQEQEQARQLSEVQQQADAHKLLLLEQLKQQQQQQRERQLLLEQQERELQQRLEELHQKVALQSNQLQEPQLSRASSALSSVCSSAASCVSNRAAQAAARAAARVSARRQHAVEAAAAAAAPAEKAAAAEEGAEHTHVCEDAQQAQADENRTGHFCEIVSSCTCCVDGAAAAATEQPKQEAEQKAARGLSQEVEEAARIARDKRIRGPSLAWSVCSNDSCSSKAVPPSSERLPEEQEKREAPFKASAWAECWIAAAGSSSPPPACGLQPFKKKETAEELQQEQQDEPQDQQQQEQEELEEGQKEEQEDREEQQQTVWAKPAIHISCFEATPGAQQQQQQPDNEQEHATIRKPSAQSSNAQSGRSLHLQLYDVITRPDTVTREDYQQQQQQQEFAGEQRQGEFAYEQGPPVPPLWAPPPYVVWVPEALETEPVPLEALSPEDQRLVREAIASHLQQPQQEPGFPPPMLTAQMLATDMQAMYLTPEEATSAAAAVAPPCWSFDGLTGYHLELSKEQQQHLKQQILEQQGQEKQYYQNLPLNPAPWYQAEVLQQEADEEQQEEQPCCEKACCSAAAMKAASASHFPAVASAVTIA
ncbi:hypothetical protein Efla_005711 [Eimeria flavescens]